MKIGRCGVNPNLARVGGTERGRKAAVDYPPNDNRKLWRLMTKRQKWQIAHMSDDDRDPPAPEAPPEADAPDADAPGLAEQRARVAHAVLRAAIRLAAAGGLSLKQLGALLEMGYFELLRREGLDLKVIAERLGVSLRTVDRLSKQLKHNFADFEDEHTLPRRIELVLWAGARTEGRILQALGEIDRAQVKRTLDRLVDSGRLLREDGRTPRYGVARQAYRLVRDAWLARLDGLDNLLRSVGNTIEARFFRPTEPAFARTLNLHVRPADLPRLTRLYEDIIWKELAALDAAAEGDPDAVTLDFSVLWAPHDLLDGDKPSE